MAENKINLSELRVKLDKAVDRGDMAEIEILLDEISAVEEDYIKPDEPAKFAEHIRNIKRKDVINMKRKMRFTKTAAIAAAIAVVATVSVSGAMLLKQYSFSEGDKFYTISSNSEIDQSVIDNIKTGKEIENSDISKVYAVNATKDESFKSIEEAEKYLDMKVILPKIMPDMEIVDVKAQKVEFGEGNVEKSIWATYGNIEEKAFGISVFQKDYNEAVSGVTINEMDEGSGGEYISSGGCRFDTFNESDETGEKTANVFVTSKGGYQYALSFFNFSDEEMYAVIDSFNLN